MITLQLPSTPDKAQLEAVIEILEDVVDDKFQKGIQIFRGDVNSSRFQSDEELVKILSSVDIPSDYRNTLHAPISPKKFHRGYRLDCPESEDEMMRTNFRLAKRLGVRSLVVHAGTSYFHPDAKGLTEEQQDYVYTGDRQSEFNDSSVVFQRATELCRNSPVQVSFENLPFPINAKSVVDPTVAFYDPFFTTPSQLVDFTSSLSPIPQAGLCIDTDHYIRFYETLQRLKYDDDQFVKSGLSPLMTGLSQSDGIPLGAAMKILLATHKVFDVQIADSMGWAQGGIPPKSFNITEGEHTLEIRDCIYEIKAFSELYDQEVRISVDVNEKDYIKRPNQRESLRYVVDVLSE